MSMKDNFLQTLMPIADNYSNPVSAAAGIIGLTNPGLGMALRYGPQVISILQGLYQAGGGSGLGARGASSGGMSGMVPSSLAANPSGVGGRGGLPLSDLSQYFQRGRALDDSDVRGNIPTMNQGGEVNMSIMQELMNRVNPPNPPGMQLLYPNQPPGPRNPYIPRQMPGPIDTTGRLGQIPPSSGPGPFSGGVNVGAPANLGGSLGGMGADPSIIERAKALAANYSGQSAPNPQAQFSNLMGTVQGGGGGSAPMPNPFMGGSPFGFNIDQSQIDRIREIIRQRQQQMAQPAQQQPQMDPAMIRARLDEFLANNPDMSSISLPFGGSIDIASLRDRIAQMMGQGATAQGAVSDTARQFTAPPTGFIRNTAPIAGSGAISDRINALLGAVRGGGGP
jgi:hypothetical protein